VTLLVVGSDAKGRRHGEPGAGIALYLARLGVRVEMEQVLSDLSNSPALVKSGHCTIAHSAIGDSANGRFARRAQLVSATL